MLKFPYGRRDFYKLITEEYLYLDRTHHIPFFENWGKELIFLRPRRFGKSLWLSTLMNYYDVAKADDFERLFGHLAIGQEPTPLHNRYLVMRWDLSRVSSKGSVDEIQKSLSDHVNTRAKIFHREYSEYLRFPIELDPENALSTFDLLVNNVRQSGHQLYLFIDEYDNFANEVLMSTNDLERYIELVKHEGIFKTFFKNLKSAGSGDGLDRIFVTGVSPLVLNDVTSGANVFEDISWEPKLNELCGFTEAELHTLVVRLVQQCNLPAEYIEQIMALMHNYYNGSCFIDDYYQPIELSKVYNPTLSFHFLKEFQERCRVPKNLVDQNLVPDGGKLRYIANYRQGRELLEDALEDAGPIATGSLSKRFEVKDLANPNLRRDRLAALLCYLGALTSVGEQPDGQVVLEIPNLVMRRLYSEQILFELVEHDENKLQAGHDAAAQLFIHGHMQPLCTFVEEHLFPLYANRDAKDFRELTLKTLFITSLYHTQMYLIDSEREAGQRYSDLLMLVRPGMEQRGLHNILIEFKQLPLSKVTEGEEGKKRSLDKVTIQERSEASLMALENVKAEFTAAEDQLLDYRQKLISKYGAGLTLRAYAVVGLGFARILWKEV